jgi:hypothetical protein
MEEMEQLISFIAASFVKFIERLWQASNGMEQICNKILKTFKRKINYTHYYSFFFKCYYLFVFQPLVVAAGKSLLLLALFCVISNLWKRFMWKS